MQSQTLISECLAKEKDKFFDIYTPLIFGKFAVQIGFQESDMLSGSMIRNRIICTNCDDGCRSVQSVPEYLPFADETFDLIIMPHTLDYCENPFQVMREVSRVLRVNGKILITGFNSLSIWRLRAKFIDARFLPLNQLTEWCEYFELNILRGRFMIYALPFESKFAKLSILDDLGDRWLARSGAVYCLKLTKNPPVIRKDFLAETFSVKISIAQFC